jgi:hypothetical protein
VKHPRATVRKRSVPKSAVPAKVAPPESICDACSSAMPVDEAQTCEDCGETFCEKHIGACDHGCEET